MTSALFFVWFSVAVIWTVNALRRPVPPGKGMAPLWLPAMIVSELAAVFFIARALVAAIFVILGGTDLTIGKIGLVLFLVSELGLVLVLGRSIGAARRLGYRVTLLALLDFRDRTPSWEIVDRGIPYADGLTLDMHRRNGITHAPTLIYLHPGSWMRGRPGRQARSLIHRLVEDGWVVLDVRYPLSPAATFPDHLIGVKQAIAWAKSTGKDSGVDPDRVVVAGGSAGAHLAALAALTADDKSLQPGFERTDVSVAGCVPFYGIFDLFNRNRTRYDWPFVPRYVMKATKDDDPDLYKLGSPLDLIGADAPPFHVIHGEFDSVVLPAESRHFVAALEAQGNSVVYTEVGAAQHGFDGLNGLRAKAIGALCADWLNDLVAD